jgi:hypothetical protein
MFVHYIYDKILLPTIRQNIRGRIFEQRDILRNELIKLEGSGKLTLQDKKAFKQLDDSINRAVNRLHLLTISNILRARNGIMEADIARIERYKNVIKGSGSKTPQKVHTQVNLELKSAFAMNSLLMLIYALPIFFVICLLSFVMLQVRKTIENVADVKEKYIEILQSDNRDRFKTIYT